MNKDVVETDESTTIGNLSKSLGISTRTLRYWEEAGIIESLNRPDRTSRGYSPYMVRRIKFILKLKELGLSIKEMQYLYTIYSKAKKTESMLPELVNILEQHINTLDEKISSLLSIRKDILEYKQKIASKQFWQPEKPEANSM